VTDTDALTTTGNGKGKPAGALTARGQRTRASLIESARTVFERDGFLNARITDIAETAGVAHGSFYSYFTSKEEIFRAAIQDLQEKLTRPDSGTDPQEPEIKTFEDAVLAANRRYLRTWRSHTALMRLWQDVANLDSEVDEMFDVTRTAFVRRNEIVISRWRAQGRTDPEVDPRIAAHALTAMISRFAYDWFTREENFDFDEAAEQLSRLWLNALGVSESDRKQPWPPDGGRTNKQDLGVATSASAGNRRTKKKAAQP
jgi:AcrR family transcriptional regulator